MQLGNNKKVILNIKLYQNHVDSHTKLNYIK